MRLPRAVYPRTVGDWLRRARIIQIDPDPAEIGKNHPVEFGLLGDIETTLETLAFPAAPVPERRRARAATVPDRDTRGPITPADLSSALADRVRADVVLVDDSQSMGGYLKREAGLADADAILGTLASHLGWGIPAAVGAQRAVPDRRVVAVVSDGSYLLGVQALWTAARYGIPVVVIVLDNRGFLSLRRELRSLDSCDAQRVTHLDAAGDRPDYVGISRGFGVDAVAVHTLAEFTSTLDAALAGSVPTVVVARMSQEVTEWDKGWVVPDHSTL